MILRKSIENFVQFFFTGLKRQTGAVVEAHIQDRLIALTYCNLEKVDPTRLQALKACVVHTS